MKPLSSPSHGGTVALCPGENDYVAAHKVYLCCRTQALLKDIFETTYKLTNISNFFHQQIPQISLWQMRYYSLLNSKKWQSDSSKGWGTSPFWLSHNVKLLHPLPNYLFSNLDSSDLDSQFFLKFDLVISKWPKFNNWNKILVNIIYLIHLTWHQTLCIILAFWVVSGWARKTQHLGLSLSHFL